MFTMRCLFVHVQEYCTRSTHVKNVLPIVKQFIVYNVVAVYEGTFVLYSREGLRDLLFYVYSTQKLDYATLLCVQCFVRKYVQLYAADPTSVILLGYLYTCSGYQREDMSLERMSTARNQNRKLSPGLVWE